MDDDDDNGMDTCHTFRTESEARAFMLGFHMAAKENICCGIDKEEPQTVLISFVDIYGDGCTEAHGHYLRTITDFNAEPMASAACDLELSFHPDAIRSHFETNDRLQALSDEQLRIIGETALGDDLTYKTFNRTLRDACKATEGFDPEPL